MKVISVKIPTIEELKSVPSFKRKSQNPYLIGSKAIMNLGLYSFITINGVISTVGKEYEEEGVRLIIELLPENVELPTGTIIEFDGILFEVIDGNKAFSLENISIDRLFEPVYTTLDPNKGNDIFVGYEINEKALSEWFDSTSKNASITDANKYNYSVHETIERQLFEQIIKYDYLKRKMIVKRFYSSNEEQKYELDETKMNQELIAPNLFIDSLIDFFIEATTNDYPIEQCALYLLKSHHELTFNDDLENASPEKKELIEKEIELINPIYELTKRYIGLNNEYDQYFTSISMNKATIKQS